VTGTSELPVNTHNNFNNYKLNVITDKVTRRTNGLNYYKITNYTHLNFRQIGAGFLSEVGTKNKNSAKNLITFCSKDNTSGYCYNDFL
jgi:hypothetical protein